MQHEIRREHQRRAILQAHRLRLSKRAFVKSHHPRQLIETSVRGILASQDQSFTSSGLVPARSRMLSNWLPFETALPRQWT